MRRDVMGAKGEFQAATASQVQSFLMLLQPGQKAQGPHSAGNPATNRCTRQRQAPQPVPARVQSETFSTESASWRVIADRMSDART